jgi:hypothetical protein
MPFTCVVCTLEILVGDQMLHDGKGAVAHDSCIVRETQIPKVAHLPSVHIPSVTVLPQTVTVSGASKLSVQKPVVEPDACVPTNNVQLCVECGKSCISMCPYCKTGGKLTPVCHGYGWSSINCSNIHETRCKGARDARSAKRDPEPKPVAPVTRKPKPKKKRARR